MSQPPSRGGWRLGVYISAFVILVLSLAALPPIVSPEPEPSRGPMQVSLPMPEPELRIRVWEGDRYRDLLYCLPLETESELRIEAVQPAGMYVTLFWVSGGASIQTIATAEPASTARTIAYPAEPSKSVSVTGEPGTEIVFLCARASSPVRDQELLDAIGRLADWPPLPMSSYLKLSQSRIVAVDSGRPAGELRERADTEGDLMGRLDEIRSRLQQRCDAIAAIAFSHR